MAQVIPMLSPECSKAAPPRQQQWGKGEDCGVVDGRKQVTCSHSSAPELNLALQEIMPLSPQTVLLWNLAFCA